MTEQADPTAINKINNSELVRFDDIVDKLLKDERIAALPQHEQGGVIADRFIGALIRYEKIKGTEKEYSPLDVIALMDTPDAAENEFTSTAGLRRAVGRLVEDSRVVPLFGGFKHRLSAQPSETGDVSYTLNSAAQLEGYLLAGGSRNFIKDAPAGYAKPGEQWIDVLMERAHSMSGNQYQRWLTNEDALSMMDSDLPSYRFTGSNWDKSLASAKIAGVDIDLLQRSFEHVQKRAANDPLMGSAGLFLATEGRLTQYRKAITDKMINI